VTYDLVPRTLTLTAGNGGSVSVTPGTANCGANCQSYPHGTSLTLTATPDLGYNFSSWTGGCANQGATCTMTLDANATIRANFTVQTTTLTVTPPQVGTITVGTNTCTPTSGTCIYNFTYFETATVTANAPISHEANKWGGSCGVFGAAVTCTLAMTTNRTASHTFIPKFVLTTSAIRGGGPPQSRNGVACGTPANCWYISRSAPTVTIDANADPFNEEFGSWQSTACAGQMTPCTHTLTADTAVAAAYRSAPQITINMNGRFTGKLVDTTRGNRTICASANQQCVVGFPRGPLYHLVAIPDTAGRPVSWDVAGGWKTVTLGIEPAPLSRAFADVDLTQWGYGAWQLYVNFN